MPPVVVTADGGARASWTVIVGVLVGVFVGVGVSVGVEVLVGVSVGDGAGVSVGVFVLVGVSVGEGVGVDVSVGVGVLVGVSVGVCVAVFVAVAVGVLVGASVAEIVASLTIGSIDSPPLSRSLCLAPVREKSTAVEAPGGRSSRKRIVATFSVPDGDGPVSVVAERSIRPCALSTWLKVTFEKTAGFASMLNAGAPLSVTASSASGSKSRYASTVSAVRVLVSATSVRATVPPDAAETIVGSR